MICRFGQPLRFPEFYDWKERVPDTSARVAYWTYAARNGRPYEPVATPGPGCTLMRHWKVDDPDVAFAPWWFWPKRGNRPVPDLVGGPWHFLASKRARDVFDEADPATHQFFPIDIAGKDGAPWDGPSHFAMVPGLAVEVEPPTRDMPKPKTDAVMTERIRRIEATPGVPARLAELPVWTLIF